MEKLTVRTDWSNLQQSLRAPLAHRDTVIKELMQDAWRAKASYVAIDYDHRTQTLSVRDDGIGISDWQKPFASSGSDVACAGQERAFGAGFMKGLCSARRCSVRSGANMVAFDTLAALQQLPIEVRRAAYSAQTSVTLEGVALPQIEERMEILASAFPIRVLYNAAVVPRPLALDGMQYQATAIGQVHLVGTEDGNAVASILLVLQGFTVYGDPRLDREANVVHLDSRQFQARFPERDVLLGEADVVRQVEAALKAMWRARLQAAKRTLDATIFVARFFAAAATWGASDLFADVPLLPGRLFARIAGYPIQEGGRRAEYLQAQGGLVRREQFASGELRAVMLPATEQGSFAYWMFAKAKGLWVLTRAWGVAEGHWLWEYVRVLDDWPAEVAIVGERGRATLEGQGVTADVVLCEAYRVRIDGEVAELTDQALAWSGTSGQEPILVVPAGEQRGSAVRQCSSYADADGRWRGEFADQDCAALSRLIGRLRAQDPTEALRSLLGELKLENYPCLHGRTFSLQVGGRGSWHEVRLVA